MNIEQRQQFNATHCTFAEEGYPAAYVLEALDGEDLARFRIHVPTCPICTAEVATLGVTAAQFPLLIDPDTLDAPELQPSPELRDRLLAAIAAERPATRSQRAELPPPVPFPNVRRWPQVYAAAAVLLLALSLGLIAWNLDVQGQVRQARNERDQAQSTLALTQRELQEAQAALDETRFQLASTGGQGASGEIVYLADRQQAVIVVNGLPALAPGQVYQLWLIGDGAPQPANIFLTTTTAVQANLTQFQVAAITIEPGPTGSAAPTMNPLVTASLRVN